MPFVRFALHQTTEKGPEDQAVGAVYAEQVAAVYRQLPIAFVVNLVNAGLVAVTLSAARLVPALWFGAVVVVTIGRAGLWWFYRTAEKSRDRRWWSTAAAFGALCAGLTWGVGGAVLLPEIAPLARLFLTMVIGGMCIGAVVVNAWHLPTLLAFVFSACLPMAGRFIAEGTPQDAALGAMIVVFAVAMTFAAAHLNRVFSATMRLRFELDQANRRLHAEIAEHRTTEAALHQAQKLEAIGHLAGGIAHDFNNLLTVVIGDLVMAKDRIGPDSAAAPLIQGAAQAAERGVALIQRLLGFARRQRLDPQPVDVGQLLLRIKEMLLTTLGPQIRLVIDISPGIPPAELDPGQLELAILNLAINARDAMPQGGTLRIGIANRPGHSTAPSELAAGDYVVVEIVDTGTGMDEATLARAFDPFFTTKELGAGTGLGLATVQGFVAQSGGAVRLSSRLGAGTTVELWLPIAEALPHETAAPQPAQSATQPVTRSDALSSAAQIVICDDDPDVRRYVADYLGAVGYIVHQATSAEEALRLVEAIAFDLLIIDHSMPTMTGAEVVYRARQRRPELKALLISSHAGAVNGGAGIAILRKPFRPAELRDKIRDIMGGKDAIDAV